LKAAHITQGIGQRQSPSAVLGGSLTAGEGCVIPRTDAIDLCRQIVRRRFPDTFMNNSCSPTSPIVSKGRRTGLLLGLLGICICLGLVFVNEGAAKTKEKQPRVPRPEPELKIVDLNISPVPYVPGNGPLELAATIQLPKELNGSAILEVTALISSPSKTSLRFLTHRQPIHPSVAAHGGTERPKLSVQLSWDGKDHRKKLAAPGQYAYEVKTKILTDGEKGLRTMMVAWPKRGTLEVQ
jgi:hypothetical protein